MPPDFPNIDSDDWDRIEAHLERIADLSPAEREQYLARLDKEEPDIAPYVREASTPGRRGFSTPLWQPLPDSRVRAFETGDLLNDRYVIQSFLGEGGAGQVYRAWDRNREEPIALKTIRPAMVDSADAVSALRNELRTASMVSHTNVCRLYDIEVAAPGSKDASFITMELLEGESLAARIRRGRIPLEEALPIIGQIVAALTAAHVSNIVHRDLKPANIFLVPRPALANGRGSETVGKRVVVMDFGLARDTRTDSGNTATMASGIAGTPAYMAPEQLRGEMAAAAFDIHALGAIMFEMVTGRLPFEGDTPMAIGAARLNGEAPSARLYVPGLDPRWERTISACLASDPLKRPERAVDVLRLLETPVPRKWPRRVFTGALAAAGVAAVIEAFRYAPLNPAAKTALARGQVFRRRQTVEGIENAIVEFRRATELEPRWAEAWSNLADAYAAASNASSADPAAAIAEARKAARTAIGLDRRLARAHGSLAWTLALDFDRWPEAEAEFSQAIALDGRDPEVRRWYGVYLRKLGRFREAEEQLRAGLDLTQQTDPRLLSELAFLHFVARQNDRFIAQVAEARKLFRNDSFIESMYAKSLEMQGKFDEALDVLNYSARLGMNSTSILALRAGLAITRKDLPEARALASQVETKWRERPVDGLVLAGVYARLGEANRAVAVLERAYQLKDNTLLSLATYPWIDPIRSDQRLQALLSRLHFTPRIMSRIEIGRPLLSRK